MAPAQTEKTGAAALARPRNGDAYMGLAAGFEIGVTTTWHYVQEAIAPLTATAEDLATGPTTPASTSATV